MARWAVGAFLLAFAFLLVAWIARPSPRAVNAPLERSKALADLDLLVTEVEQIHPSKQLTQWHAWAIGERNALAATWPASVPAREFMWQAQRLLSRLHDSHTRASLYPAWNAYREQGGVGFPARLASRVDGVYVQRDSAVQLGLASDELRLVAINGRPVDTVLSELAGNLSGESAHLRREEAIATLPMLLWYAGQNAHEFQLDLLRADGSTMRRTVMASVAAPQAENEGAVATALTLHGPDAWLPILTLDTQASPALSEALDLAISRLKTSEARRLIIDLRGNGGGDAGIAYDLLQQVSARDFRIGSKHWRYSRGYRNAMLRNGVRQRGLPDWLGLHHVLNLEWFAPIARDRYQADGEWLQSHGRKIEHASDAWHGQLVVLVDRFTYSSAVDLAATVQDNHLGCIGGEESGGYASYFGEVAPIRLPDGNALAQISSSVWLRPSGDDSAHGVIPDADCLALPTDSAGGAND